MDHLTLFEFSQAVKKILEKNLQPTYWIVAEIGEIRIHAKGHCYLELIEKKDENIVARMKATIWAYTYQNLIHWFSRITGSELKEGMKILVNAEAQYHEAFGLSLNIKDLDANYTLGERQKIKQQIIDRLKEENLITRNHALELPLAPQRIAIISSPQSAGYQDFIQQLDSSAYRFETNFFSAEMQGQEATRSMVEGLKNIFARVHEFDLVVILRGGGAQSDLDSFNTYLLGKAIARFPLPVITGIGHERDETIADLVAKVRLKTPTAVAEFLIDGMRDFDYRIQKSFKIILGNAQHRLLHDRHLISQKTKEIQHNSQQVISSAQSRINLFREKIVRITDKQKQDNRHRLNSVIERLSHGFTTSLNQSTYRINVFEKFFHYSDPEYAFSKGFTYSTIEGVPLSKRKKIKKGEVISTRTAKKVIESIVKEVS